MQIAELYLRGESIYVYSSSRTDTGVWVAAAPFIHCPVGAVELLVSAVQQALDASLDNQPPPLDWNRVLDPLWGIAGVTDWQTFAESAKCVAVKRTGNELSLVPHRNLGPEEGFEPIAENTIRMPTSTSASELGAAMMRAFQKTE